MPEQTDNHEPPSQHVGPDYRQSCDKPSATVSVPIANDNVHVLPQTPQLISLLTMIRDKNTGRADFIFYSNRIIRLLVEEGLNHLPVIQHEVTTPVGRTYSGVKFEGKICGVSIMRAGEAMEQGLRECCRSVRIGKILIQRDEETSKPRLYYDKLPEDIKDRWVLLLDPMLATGGSALMAAEVLIKKGVPEDHILFLNLIASPEGAKRFAQQFPKLRIITAFVDQGLNEKKYVSRTHNGLSVTDLPSAISCRVLATSVIDTIPCRIWKSLWLNLYVLLKAAFGNDTLKMIDTSLRRCIDAFRPTPQHDRCLP